MTTTERDARGGPLDAELTAPLDDETFYGGDPFPHYSRLRAEAPVAWNPNLGYWAVSKHADVLAISRDPASFCSAKGILTLEIGIEYPTPPTMMHTDPPEHTRYRTLVQPGFTGSRIRALEPAVRRRARELVDTIEAGSPFDVVGQVTVPFPLMIIAALLGIPDDAWPQFYRWSEATIPGATDWAPEERQALMVEMQQYLLTATRERRGDPRDDIISVLANEQLDGEQLTDDELVMFLNQLLVAGNETTRNTLSGGLWELAVSGGWARLAADRSLIDTTVEEMLRWTTSVIAFMRTATRDVELRGRDVLAGDPLLLLYASANRDEEVFGPTAESFDVARSPNHHVAFGFGPHFCIGAALARLEGRVLLEELLDRFSRLEVAGEIERTNSAIIAGVTAAPLVFDV